MQDDTALYGAKMMQPGMTAADSEENNLRPQHLEDYIGQEKVKQNLKIYLEAAKRRGEPMDTSCSTASGSGQDDAGGHHRQRDGVQIRITSGPAIEKPGDLAALLTNLQEATSSSSTRYTVSPGRWKRCFTRHWKTMRWIS